MTFLIGLRNSTLGLTVEVAVDVVGLKVVGLTVVVMLGALLVTLAGEARLSELLSFGSDLLSLGALSLLVD